MTPAAKRLSVVAAALGPKRTREELLPFLSDGVDDDDEVLGAIATSLRDLVPHVGGRNHLSSLLHPLELLLAVEENVVRERAAESAIAVGEQMYDEDYRAEFVGMISRLATKEWFTARISACGLIHVAFPRMSSSSSSSGGDGGMRMAHLAHFANLCRDDAPMVRRIASRNLGPLLHTVVVTIGPSCLDEGGAVSAILLDLYESLAGGDQPDSVRLHTTQNCVHLGQAITLMKERVLSSSSLSSSSSSLSGGLGDGVLGEEGENTLVRINAIVKRILPLIVATIDDRSWRVRWTAASKFASVVHAFSKLDGSMDALVPAYEKLLQDPEAEVRTAATFNFSEVAKTGAMVCPAGWAGGGGFDVGPADPSSRRIPVALRLVKRVVQLTEDDSENVRAALAMVATDLAPVLGRDATITHLLPPMLLLLRDSNSEVRLNIISSLSLLNEVIGAELLTQSLLPAILDLADDGKWRIRLAVIERIPLLAKQLGKEFFTDRLLSLCVGWLGDDISSIREAAAADLKELTALLGSEWAVQNLLPRVKQMMEHQSYLRRMNAVRALSLMATAMDAHTAQWEILPILLEMHCDPVPNVRFNVAKGLGMIGPLFQSSYEGQILPILTLMMDDPDRDVRYFATQASDSLRAFFGTSNKS
ncbi:hypothetical protein ACHAW5_004531 [Stephanodiscus triporus]|uniref:Phosphatase 2A Regulatory Subunit A helical domain-containing protein n=1 Tax=Stephanodiscus triporus TaxID=2934178 RepID=A0ABD3P2J2_9STRA